MARTRQPEQWTFVRKFGICRTSRLLRLRFAVFTANWRFRISLPMAASTLHHVCRARAVQALPQLARLTRPRASDGDFMWTKYCSASRRVGRLAMS